MIGSLRLSKEGLVLYLKVHVPFIAEELHRNVTMQSVVKNKILRTFDPSNDRNYECYYES